MNYKTVYASPFGTIILRSDGTYLTGLWFEGSRDSAKHTGVFAEEDLPIFAQTREWLDQYFSGREPEGTVPYRMEGLTPFRRQVMEILERIPYGEVTTYQAIAQEIARQRGIEKMSAQAVGGAVGWNPICILVPCHRVVGTNGSLTGYGGGMANKCRLLELEGHDLRRFTIPKEGHGR